MSQSKKVILIPHWVSETLSRHKLPIYEALNFAKLREIVSLADLAGMEVLNRHGARIGLKEHSSYELGRMWMRPYSEGDAPLNYYYGSVAPYADLPTTEQDVIARLFSPDAWTNRYEKPFIIYDDLSHDHIGVVINPGFFTGEEGTTQRQFDFLEELIKALYVYAPTHVVAATSVFHQYLGLLSKKRIMV